MNTALFTHPACLQHDTGPDHPERIERLKVILGILERPEFYLLDRREAPQASMEQLIRVHDPLYVDRMLAAIPKEGQRMFNDDTVVSPGSWEAALRAAGAVCAAVDAVLTGENRNAFCAVRPPGHHAEPAESMGFCLFNNVAVGAAHARAIHGLKRVAVVDFDVHHGNGTQAMFQNDPNLFYASTHEWPLYPGTGARGETGCAHNIVNAPLPGFAGSEEFRAAMEDIIFPALLAFKPELLMISAGFDAHRRDPLASLQLDEDDFAGVTRRLCEIADAVCNRRVVSTLEGGYDLMALASSCAAHVRELMAW